MMWALVLFSPLLYAQEFIQRRNIDEENIATAEGQQDDLAQTPDSVRYVERVREALDRVITKIHPKARLHGRAREQDEPGEGTLWVDVTELTLTGRVTVEVKYRSHARLETRVLQDEWFRSHIVDRPVLIVSNVELTNSALAFLDKEGRSRRGTIPRLGFVTWVDEDDNKALGDQLKHLLGAD